MDLMGSVNKTRYKYKHQRSARLEPIINTTQRKLEDVDDETIERAIEREHSEENTWYIDPDGPVNWVRQALVQLIGLKKVSATVRQGDGC